MPQNPLRWVTRPSPIYRRIPSDRALVHCLQEEREARESVKREQDEAYEHSLREDRAKVWSQNACCELTCGQALLFLLVREGLKKSLSKNSCPVPRGPGGKEEPDRRLAANSQIIRFILQTKTKPVSNRWMSIFVPPGSRKKTAGRRRDANQETGAGKRTTRSASQRSKDVASLCKPWSSSLNLPSPFLSPPLSPPSPLPPLSPCYPIFPHFYAGP